MLRFRTCIFHESSTVLSFCVFCQIISQPSPVLILIWARSRCDVSTESQR